MADAADLPAEAARLVQLAVTAKLTIATAESCTGGLIAAYLTEIPGSSAVLERGFVTYSNAAKVELLGVEAAAVATHGAVSEVVARQMATGALRSSRADISVAVTGIAGPGGGSKEKPVGLVHFAAAKGGMVLHRSERFGDVGRERVRRMSVAVAFEMLATLLTHVDEHPDSADA